MRIGKEQQKVKPSDNLEKEAAVAIQMVENSLSDRADKPGCRQRSAMKKIDWKNRNLACPRFQMIVWGPDSHSAVYCTCSLMAAVGWCRKRVMAHCAADEEGGLIDSNLERFW